MIVREIRNEDEPVVRELVFRVLREFGLKPSPEDTDRDLFQIEECYRGGSFDVLEIDGVIVGTVGIMRMDDRLCELRKMYLDAGHRGKGYGKVLLNHGLAKARELGFRSVCLETANVLQGAIRLYEAYGFERYEPEHMAARCDQAYILHLDSTEHS